MSKAQNGVFSALRVRDFRLLWIGQSVSSLGDGVFTVALALTALKIGKRPIDLAYVIAARAIPSIGFAIIGGVVADRFSRRTMMLLSDLVRGSAVGAVALLLMAGRLRFWELIVMAVVFGVADAFFSPASMAIIPEIVSDEQITQANALGQMSGQATQGIIGPAIGGIIVAVIGYSWSMGFNALSFGVSAVSLLLMRVRRDSPSSEQSVIAEAMEGINFIRARKWLFATLFVGCMANFFGWFPLAVLLPLLVRTTFHGSTQSLGLILTAGGVAGLLATIVVARLGSPRRNMTTMWIIYSIGALAIAGMGLAPNLWIVGLLSATQVGLFLYGDILYVSMMQKLIPKEVLGRVWSVALLFSFAGGPLGYLLAGVMATAIGIQTTVFCGGLISLGFCVGVMFVPEVRQLDRTNSAIESMREIT